MIIKCFGLRHPPLPWIRACLLRSVWCIYIVILNVSVFKSSMEHIIYESCRIQGCLNHDYKYTYLESNIYFQYKIACFVYSSFRIYKLIAMKKDVGKIKFFTYILHMKCKLLNFFSTLKLLMCFWWWITICHLLCSPLSFGPLFFFL